MISLKRLPYRITKPTPVAMPSYCPTCQALLPTLVKELMEFAKAEYDRGLRDAANLVHAQADRRLNGSAQLTDCKTLTLPSCGSTRRKSVRVQLHTLA